MDLKATYDKIAEDWFKDHVPGDRWQKAADLFISLLPSGARVLDAGCGGGIVSRYLLSKGLSVAATDFSEKMIEIVRRESPGMEAFVMDIRDVIRLKENFDGIYAKAVLLHIPKKEISAVLKGLAAKLKVGGYIYVAVKGTHPGQPDEAVLAEESYGYRYERFFSFFSMAEMEQHFAERGFALCYKNAAPAGSTIWLELIGKKVF